MNGTVQTAAGAGFGVGGFGLGVWALLRFVRWACEFIAGRLDRRAATLDAREQSIQNRMNKRLEHVEAELDAHREALMLLINRVAEKDPKDPVLRDVARILRKVPPRPTLAVDEIVDRLNDIPGTGELQ